MANEKGRRQVQAEMPGPAAAESEAQDDQPRAEKQSRASGESPKVAGTVQCRVTCDLWHNGKFYPEGTVEFFPEAIAAACPALTPVDG